jgi:hypothetical protein
MLPSLSAMTIQPTNQTDPMKLHTYTIPAETKFRSLTIDAAVEELTPDGFTADTDTAADILAELAEAGGLTLGDWDTYGADGAERMLVWESADDAANDDGSRALCQILREPA